MAVTMPRIGKNGECWIGHCSHPATHVYTTTFGNRYAYCRFHAYEWAAHTGSEHKVSPLESLAPPIDSEGDSW